MLVAWGFWQRRRAQPRRIGVPPGPLWRPVAVGMPFGARGVAWAPPRRGAAGPSAVLAAFCALTLALVVWAARESGPAVGAPVPVVDAEAGATGLPGGPAPASGTASGLVQAETANAARELAASLPPVAPWDTAVVRTAAQVSGLPTALVAAVIYEESRGDPQAVSPAGAEGLMQLEPATAAALGVRNIFNPRQNAVGGSRYLAGWLRAYGGAGCVLDPDTCPRAFVLALAAYNAGPGAVRRYGGVPPYPATVRYVRQVQARYHAYLASS